MMALSAAFVVDVISKVGAISVLTSMLFFATTIVAVTVALAVAFAFALLLH